MKFKGGKLLLLIFSLFIVFCTVKDVSAASGPVISEFMASNTATLKDEDGDFSDWIEIYNPTEDIVDLTGWFLTDDPENLEKWQFPVVKLEPGRFLLVFASGKNRTNPDYELHTNFKLLSSGEFLGLVSSDGLTVVSGFSEFPHQMENISYGFTQDSHEQTLIGPEADATALIPTDDSLGLSWTDPSFSDAGWKSGKTGIGYEKNSGYESLINIDVRSEMAGNNCTAYIRIPFNIEDASEIGSLKLNIKYDDGFAAYINGEEVTSRNAPTSLAWNSTATSLHDDSAAVVFEEITLFNASAYLQNGVNVLAIHGLNDNLGSSDFLVVPELYSQWAGPMNLAEPFFLATPSPGGPNSSGSDSVSGPPEFSHQSGTYKDPFTLTLSSEASNAVIRYSLNWKEPDENSQVYTSPISIDKDTMVRARVFEPGAIPSWTVTRSFTVLQENVENFSSNLPLIVLNTYNTGIGQNNYTGGYAEFYDVGDNGRSSLENVPDLGTIVGLRLRGSSSMGFPKKMFAMETWDERGNDKDVPLLGLPTESDWVLYAPYSDKSLIRNVLSYGWANKIGRYAPRTRLVELFLNTGTGPLDMTHYHGVYVLVEKIKRSQDRVNIAKLLPSQNSEPEISGGYIMKIDRLDPGDQGLATNRGTQICYVKPKERDISEPQKQWIKKYMDDFETALYAANFSDPDDGYAKYIDVDSWVDNFLMVELMKNIDGYRLSTYFYKDRGGKLVMGPIWDYNLSLGNANYLHGWVTEGWYLDEANWSWWVRLFNQCPDFRQRFIDRWANLRRNEFRKEEMLEEVDELAEYLEEAQERNFNRWQILGQYIWPNWFVANTYGEEIDFLKGWLSGRIDWIDGLFVKAPEFNKNGGPIKSGFELTISAPIGLIYYTLDGSDPRLRGGSISPSASVYDSPVTLFDNSLVIARVKNGNNWSGYTRATFVVNPPTLLISEIMYHPAQPAQPSLYDDNDYEFVELYNYGDKTQDLSGIHFTDAVKYSFPQGSSLAPKERVVVVKNLGAFSERYDTSRIIVVGNYEGFLENLGETIALEGPLGEPILEFTYDDFWYGETDGLGYSLVPVNPDDPDQDWSLSDSWRASFENGGSPGLADTEETGGWQLPGDVNQDGFLDLSDAISILGLLFDSEKYTLPCGGDSTGDSGNLVIEDVNGDESFDIADAVNILSYLFSHGTSPARGTECIRVEGCESVCK